QTPPRVPRYVLTLVVPTHANVRLNDSAVGVDQHPTDSTALTSANAPNERIDTLLFTRVLRLDSLVAGEYRVAVSVAAVEGCIWATEQRTVRVGSPGAGAARLPMTPRSCGWLEVAPRGIVADRRPSFDLIPVEPLRVRYEKERLPR